MLEFILSLGSGKSNGKFNKLKSRGKSCEIILLGKKYII